MESILTLDRLRQSVAVKELLQAKGQPLMRKTASVPNFSQVRNFLVTFQHLSLLFFRAAQALETKNGVCYGACTMFYDYTIHNNNYCFAHEPVRFSS